MVVIFDSEDYKCDYLLTPFAILIMFFMCVCLHIALAYQKNKNPNLKWLNEG